MYIVLGGTGHVGSAVATRLLDRGEQVTIVSRDPKAADGQANGAKVAIADVRDVDALRAVFRTGTRAFLLNPPAAPDTDTDAEEHRTLEAIVAALEGSGLEKLVAQSTYGAQAGERIGDLSVLYDFEQKLAAQPIPTAILRAAYYMTNWDTLLDAAKAGTLPTMYPATLALPMVAPADIAAAAVDLLATPVGETRLTYVEGPQHYTANHVAAAFADALGRPVEVQVTPRDRWVQAYRDQGFSAAAADAYARMTAASVDGGFAMPQGPVRGTVTIEDHIAQLARG